MGLIFNGTNVKSVNFNGTDLTKIIYNGVVIWVNYDEELEVYTVQNPIDGSSYIKIDGTTVNGYVVPGESGSSGIVMFGMDINNLNELTLTFDFSITAEANNCTRGIITLYVYSSNGIITKDIAEVYSLGMGETYHGSFTYTHDSSNGAVNGIAFHVDIFRREGFDDTGYKEHDENDWYIKNIKINGVTYGGTYEQLVQ